MRKEDFIQTKQLGDTRSLFDKVTQEVEDTEIKEKEKLSRPAAFKGLRDDLDDNDDNDVGM